MRRLCVFCGSSVGVRPVYAEAAREMGRLLASRGIGVVYGAEREIAHSRLTELHVVDSMHTRKAKMAELADAFVAMPGGVGTFEEFFEAITWTQLGLHRKACGLLNVDGFYTSLEAFIDQAVTEGFIRPVHRTAIVVDSDPARLIDTMSTLDLPDVVKWITPSET